MVNIRCYLKKAAFEDTKTTQPTDLGISDLEVTVHRKLKKKNKGIIPEY